MILRRRLYKRLQNLILIALVIVASMLLMGGSVLPPGDPIERVRYFTRQIEFDYAGWMLDALALKLNQVALGSQRYLTEEQQRQVVLEYLTLVGQGYQAEAMLRDVLADPTLADPETAAAEVRAVLDKIEARRDQLEPLAEAILQSQIGEVVADLGLTLGGQPVPPVLYHSTPLPLALIVSPRDAIRQDADISIVPGFPVDQFAELESQVDAALDVSSLVVNVGGIGVYPTMVYQTSNLDWLSEVVAHEWIHNFLTLRPLGASYMTTPELRIMNETAASLAGKEIGLAVLERFYPELLPEPAPEPTAGEAPAAEAPAGEAPGAEEETSPPPEPEPPAFNFVAEMRETRVTVDDLLAQGKIEAAEEYMEQRRVFFWENGYHIRKINQAYFAFYGAYADEPGGGAAGADPVGAAVRTLRERSDSLADFLNRISWMSSWEQLRQAVE